MNRDIATAVTLLCCLACGIRTSRTDETPNHVSLVYPDTRGKLMYVPDKTGAVIPDFSHAGYGGGGVPIPYVPARETVWPVSGDSAPVIQEALDRVSALPPDDNGFRGAVLLKAGRYHLYAPLVIETGGVILRGEGRGDTGTILVGHGVFEGGYKNRNTANLIEIRGTADRGKTGTSIRIVDEFVPVGARSFRVEKGAGLRVGDTVLVIRHGNASWIEEIGMDLENERWRWEPFSIPYDRTITDVSGDSITIDAPIVCAIDSRWGGGEVVIYRDRRIIRNGVENIRGESAYDPAERTTEHGNIDRHPYHGEEYYGDEDHYWNFISIDNARDAWVRNVTALHFANALVSVGAGATSVTVQDCASLAPVSKRWGGRRFTYQVSGQLTLVQRCTSDQGRHSFVLLGHRACGPNVFLNCSVTRPFSSSEPHNHYVTGALYDNVKAPLTARFWKDISIGWAGANCVFWNCEGPFLVQKPPTAQNYAFGHIGIHATVFNTAYQDLQKENGRIESWDRRVDPPSLYIKQLEERVGPGAAENIGYKNW